MQHTVWITDCNNSTKLQYGLKMFSAPYGIQTFYSMDYRLYIVWTADTVWTTDIIKYVPQTSYIKTPDFQYNFYSKKTYNKKHYTSWTTDLI